MINQLKFWLGIVLGFTAITLKGQDTGKYFAPGGKAIKGYDPVAYFEQGKPLKGIAAYQYVYEEVTWWFSSQANLDIFRQDPQKYLPKYGGYCAFGMSEGYKASTTPEAWDIVDGKLFLNYNLQVQKDWMAKKEEHIKKANTNWQNFKH